MIPVRWLLLLLHIAYAAAFLWIIARIGGWLLELIANGNSQHPALPLVLSLTVLSPMIIADYSPLVAVILGVICLVATVVLTPFSRVDRPSHQRPRL